MSKRRDWLEGIEKGGEGSRRVWIGGKRVRVRVVKVIKSGKNRVVKGKESS